MNWHVCDCGSEYRCERDNHNCDVFLGYNELCPQCEWSFEEELASEERNRELDYQLEQEYLAEYERLAREQERGT